MFDFSSLANDVVTANEEWDAIASTLGGALVVAAVILIAILVFMIIAEWKFYQKCGKQGWECIVPFYNRWVYVEMAGLNWWWFLVLIASSIVSLLFGNSDSLANIAALATLFGSFVCNYNLAKMFHKGTGFAVLMTIFPVIMFPVMAFGKSYQYDSSVTVSKNGIF